MLELKVGDKFCAGGMLYFVQSIAGDIIYAANPINNYIYNFSKSGTESLIKNQTWKLVEKERCKICHG